MGPIGPAKCRGRSLHRRWADNDEANRAGREWEERASVGWEFHPGGMAVVSQESVPTSSDIPWVRSDQQNVAGGAYTADGLTTTRLTGPEVSGEDEPLSGGNFILEERQLLAKGVFHPAATFHGSDRTSKMSQEEPTICMSPLSNTTRRRPLA